jgi:hypothetical protein
MHIIYSYLYAYANKIFRAAVRIFSPLAAMGLVGRLGI